MTGKQINIQAKTIRQLLKLVYEGRFAIPRLQREFVWDGPKAAKLLDSINAHMPIGVVLIWETPRSQRLYLRQKYHVLPQFNTRNGKVWFLIDGQQRVSVIHQIREGAVLKNARGRDIDFKRVVLSLEKQDDGQQIRYRKPRRCQYESLSDILHSQWRSRLSHLGKQQLNRVRKCRKAVLGYRVHLMFMQAKIDTIRESFLRINTQGMKITTADAIFTRAESLNLRDIRHEVDHHVDSHFGQIQEAPILFAMAAIRGAKEARGQALQLAINRLEKQAAQDKKFLKALAKDWNRLGKCFGKAIDYLRVNFRVVSRDYLYSDYMVAVLALFFFHNGKGPSARQKERIRKWFWTTSVGSRYTGRNFLKCIPSDVEFFKRLSAGRSARFDYEPEVDKADVHKSQYGSQSGITSAFYCMLLRLKPVSIMDNGLNRIPSDHFATQANRKDRHHIFPKAVLNNKGLPANRYNSIANICLLTAEENQTISTRRPRSYLGEVEDNGTYFKRKMARHLIPVHADSGVWKTDVKRGFNQFVKERTDLICKVLETEAGGRLFRRDR